jgi:hypothetical protein
VGTALLFSNISIPPPWGLIVVIIIVVISTPTRFERLLFLVLLRWGFRYRSRGELVIALGAGQWEICRFINRLDGLTDGCIAFRATNLKNGHGKPRDLA